MDFEKVIALDEGFKGYYTQEGSTAGRSSDKRRIDISIHFLFTDSHTLQVRARRILNPAHHAFLFASYYLVSILRESHVVLGMIFQSVFLLSVSSFFLHLPPYPGFYGTRGVELRLVAWLLDAAACVQGVGKDEYGELSIQGQYSVVDVAFTCRYTSPDVKRENKKFHGQRFPDMSISGRWTDDASGSTFGEFSILYESSEKRFPPSYDLNRIKLYSVLEQLATGGFGVVSRVRRVTDGKILVWKELNYQRMNKKERRMMITEVGASFTQT
jgi:hypothetical protein